MKIHKGKMYSIGYKEGDHPQVLAGLNDEDIPNNGYSRDSSLDQRKCNMCGHISEKSGIINHIKSQHKYRPSKCHTFYTLKI